MRPRSPVGRRLDRLRGTGAGRRLERRLEDQIGHAEDGAEGGANLVADVGQELVLGPVRRLGRRLRLPQLLGGLRPLDPVRGLAGQQVDDVEVAVRRGAAASL